jgi:hypothetical protein
MRKGSRLQVLFGVGAGLLVAGYSLSMMGCSDAPTTSHPPASQLQEGLNILDAHDAAWGFNAAYLKAGRVVYIESRMGQQKPEVYRNDSPDEPANEMDLRFVDQKDRTFWAQRGGDSWSDKTWSSQIGISQSIDPTLTLADRASDYDVAQEAARALVAALPAAYKDHSFHLGVFASMTPPTSDPKLLAKIQEFNDKAPVPAEKPDQAYGYYASTSWTQVYAGKWSMPLVCILWTCAASHSAVAMYSNPNVGYWQYVIAACNHGNCPGGSHMSDDCYSWNGGGWFQYGVQMNGTTTSNLTGAGDGLGGCQTSYNWDSGGYDHLCNDDAAYELWEAKSGSQWTYKGFENGDAIGFQYAGAGYCRGSFCGGGNPAYFACDCQTFNGCSGDWNTPYCP